MKAQFEALKLRFLERCASDRDVLKLQQCAPEAVSPSDLQTLIHQMSGAAGAFGFPQLSALAMRLDHQLSCGEPPSLEHVQALIDELNRIQPSLRQPDVSAEP